MSGRRSIMVKILPGAIFPLLATGIGVYVFVTSFSLQPETRFFAGGSAFILAILSFSVLVRDIARGMTGALDLSEEASTPARRGLHPVVIALAWCLGFFLCAVLIGFLFTIPLWVFALLMWTRASRVAAFVIPIVLWAIVKFALEQGLGTILYKGILFGDTLPSFW